MLRRIKPPHTQAPSRPGLFHRNIIPGRHTSTALVTTPQPIDPVNKKQLLQNAPKTDVHDLQILLRSVTNADIICQQGRHEERHVIKFEAVAPHPHSSRAQQFAQELSTALMASGIKNQFLADNTTVVLKGNLSEIMDNIGNNFATIQNNLSFSQRQFKRR